MPIKIKQIYAKLEKDLMSIFDGLRNNSKNKQLNNLRSKTANDLIGYFRKTPTNSLDLLVVIDDKEVADVQFVYDEKRKKSVFKLLLKDNLNSNELNFKNTKPRLYKVYEHSCVNNNKIK